MDRFTDEAVYNQQKVWEAEQEFHASESAKAQADIEASEEMPKEGTMEAKDTVMKVADIPVGMPERFYAFSPDELRYELGLQAEISFKAGVREVVKWITEHSQLEECDPDVMVYFTTYRWVDEDDWQTQLKIWFKEEK